MRFDPKLVSPEPPPLNFAGELELPDHLMELAAQLGADAEHLAALYQATAIVESTEIFEASTEQSEAVPHLRRSSWRLMKSLSLVAGVAGLIVVASWWWPTAERATELANHLPSPGTIATETVTSAAESPTSVTVPEAAPPAPASPSLFLHDYSGPEVEGLYDLIGEQEDGTISI